MACAGDVVGGSTLAALAAWIAVLNFWLGGVELLAARGTIGVLSAGGQATYARPHMPRVSEMEISRKRL